MITKITRNIENNDKNHNNSEHVKQLLYKLLYKKTTMIFKMISLKYDEIMIKN